MDHYSLYRRYRPETFRDVIGQEHITRTLTNQIKSGRINHAYLFTGTRGTGKTSCAKILSRAVNCLNPADGSPCNQCSVCLELKGNNMDVIEIDAASNNRVDEIRDIREKIKFTPVTAKYKVYIIDEVHMLTDSAFNALLKTLEEPPAHAIFILATTEVHKLPRTILSRCIRFDFRLIPEDDIAALIGKVYGETGKDAEYEAIRLIAQAGEGSVRDALSIADMCASYTTGRLTYFDVLEVVGGSDAMSVAGLVSAAIDGDIPVALREIKAMAGRGVNFSALSRDIVNMVRNLSIIKTCADYRALINLPETVLGRLEKTAKTASLGQLVNLMEACANADGVMRYSVNPGAILESALIKSVYTEKTAAELEARIKALEDAVESGAGVSPAAETNKKPAEIWGSVLKELRESRANPALYSACAQLDKVSAEGRDLIVLVTDGNYDLIAKEENLAIINSVIEKLRFKVRFRPREVKQEKNDGIREDIEKLKEKIGDVKLTVK